MTHLVRMLLIPIGSYWQGQGHMSVLEGRGKHNHSSFFFFFCSHSVHSHFIFARHPTLGVKIIHRLMIYLRSCYWGSPQVKVHKVKVIASGCNDLGNQTANAVRVSHPAGKNLM